MKIKSHLIAAIFGTLALIGGFLTFIITLLVVNNNVQNSLNMDGAINYEASEEIATSFVQGIILTIFIPIFFGIGVFVSGIIEIVAASKTVKNQGIGLTAGILNVVSAFMVFIPFVGWLIPIVGTVFAYIAFFINKT